MKTKSIITKMESPVAEQSEKLLDSSVTDEVSSQEEKQNISAPDTEMVDKNQKSDEQSTTSEFHHHAVADGAPSAGSAFHVVSHTDDHKDGSTMEQSNSVISETGQTDINSQDCASSRSDDQQDKQAFEKGSKIFSAQTVDQQAKSCEDSSEYVPSASQLQTVDAVAQDESSLSEIPESKPFVEGICKDDAEAITSELHTSYDDDNLKKIDSDLLNEDSKVSQIEGTKTIDDFQFLKPTVLETTGKDTPVVCSSIDNDVENELGRHHQVAVHKPEEVLNIDEETRMGLDQTPVDPSMIEASFIYPTLPPKKLFQLDDTKDSEPSDTETKMSAACDSEDIRLRNTISIDDATKDSAASDSNLDTPTPSRKQRRASRDGLGISLMEGLEAGERIFTAENLFEYQWPQDGGEWYLLQEQVSEYLKIKSFKRKYPDLLRRTCDKEEKDFLRDKGVVTETQSDLGLTALRSEEVYDLMMKDYNSKYKDYISHLQEKQKKVIREKHKEYSSAKLDKSKIDSYAKKAARSAAEFNNSLMRDRKEERRAYFDLQTYTIHYPKNKFKTMPSQYTKVGAYPVALIPGQYQENYKKYSSEELKYYPLKTSLKDPPKVIKYIQPPPSGVKLPSTDKHKNIVNSDGDDSGCSSREDNDDDIENIDNEIDDKEMEIGHVEGSDIISLVRLDKKNKVKRKYTKMSSPDRLKKVGRKMKDAEGDKDDDKVNQDGTEKGTSPDGKKMPAKIHGLEKCRICKTRSTKEERKAGKLVKCAECGKIGHMGCLDLTEELVAVIKTYPWQCMECKTCVECLDPYDEDKMMFCDRCDRGYHTFCIGLDALPTGHWECKSCEGLPPIADKPKLSLSQGSQPVRSKKGSQASAIRSSLSVKTELEVGEDESGSLKSEGQTSTDNPDKHLQAGSVSEGKETPGSEKEVKTSTAVGVQVTGERRGRKKGSLKLTPKSRAKTPKPRPSKKDIIKKARQSRRLKIKEGGKNGGEKKILKRKRKSKKMGEGEENRMLEMAGEIESGGYNMESGFGGKRARLNDFRELVGEGVDDSFVSAYDKVEDKDLELMRSVPRNIGASQSGSMAVGLKDNLVISVLKLDQMGLEASKTALKEGGFTEMEYTSEKDKIQQAFSLLPPEILQCEAMDQTTNNIVCAEGSAATLSVYGDLQDTAYVSLSSAQQPEAVDQYQALAVTDVAYSASNEGFHVQLSDPQIQFHSVPQVTSSILPVDLTDLPVSQSHVLLPHIAPQPGTLLQEIPHSESQNIPYHETPMEMPQDDLCLQDAQLQTALFSLPSVDVTMPVQHIENVPQVEQTLLDPTPGGFVCMDPSVEGLASDHPAADIASNSTQFSLDSAVRMDVHPGFNPETANNPQNENLTNL